MKKTVKPNVTPTAWSAETLFAKAVRYSESMLAKKAIDWEHALWSSLMLEHLARAALANVNPALLADSGRGSWSSLFHSLGFEPKERKFTPKSISISEVLNRLKEIFPDFTSEHLGFCNSHIGRRNAEVHSGEAIFDSLSRDAWQPQYYKACKALLETMDMSFEDLFDNTEADVAQKLIEAYDDKSARAVTGDVDAHKIVWGTKKPKEQERLGSSALVWATKQLGHRVSCPACASTSLVFGEPVSPVEVTLEHELVVERQEYLPNAFECIACELKISGLSRLVAVGLGNRYINKSKYFPEDYYAPDEVEWGGFEEDNNEPF